MRTNKQHKRKKMIQEKFHQIDLVMDTEKSNNAPL